jgi:hypothetical protein
MLDHAAFTQLDDLLPGPELAALLARSFRHASGSGAAPTDSGRDGPVADPVATLGAWQRLESWVAAGLNHAILAVAGTAPKDEQNEDWEREEVAAALHWSASATAERIDLARHLSWPLTATARALQEGRITLRHAKEISGAIRPLDDDDLALSAEAAILDKAYDRTPAQLARIARREVIKHDPHGANERHRKARKGRRVEFTPLADGMAELRAILPAEGAARLRGTLDRLAGRTRAKGDDRTIDQRRADALIALGSSQAVPPAVSSDDTAEEPPLGPAWRLAAPARIGVIAPLSTLSGQTNLPGELVGFGPIPPELVRELSGAEGVRWEKWITDPGGVVTDLGRRAYRPSSQLAALVRARNPRCVFPGCSQPSYRCDLDHLNRWSDGGTTTLSNLAPLCRRHHRAKDEAGWRVGRSADETAYEWTSPRGHTYTVGAHAYDLDRELIDDTSEAITAAEWDEPLINRPRQKPKLSSGAEQEMPAPF